MISDPEDAARNLVLLMGPHHDFAMVATTAIAELGFRVHQVASGPAAVIASFGPQRPLLLLVQCDSSCGDVVGAVSEIRKAERGGGFQRLPIVVMSMDTSEEAVRDVKDAGVDAFLEIPFSGHELAIAFASALGTHPSALLNPDLYAFAKQFNDACVEEQDDSPEGIVKH